MRRLVLLGCAVLALAACRSTVTAPLDGWQVSGNEGAEDTPGPVAVIEGTPVSKAALADFWFERYPQEYARTMAALLDERLAIKEAHRHGVRVPRAALEKATVREVKARRQQLVQVYGEHADLEAEVRRAYGTDLATWQRTVLAPRLHAQLLMERVIRWDTRRRARVEARVIVVASAERARRVHQKLAAGADFSLTAAKVSVDPSGKRGGVLPRIGRGDLAFPGVETRLFAAKPGTLVGPLEVRVEGKPQWQIYKVIRNVPAWTGTLDTQWQRLEDDLLASPVDAGEYQRWQARVRRAKGVKLYRPDGRIWTPPAAR